MSAWRARLGVYSAVALLAWGAIAVVRPIPEKRAGEVINGSRVPTWRERVDSLGRGETVNGPILEHTAAGLLDDGLALSTGRHGQFHHHVKAADKGVVEADD